MIIIENNQEKTAIQLFEYNLKLRNLELEKIIDSIEFIQLKLFLLEECPYSRLLVSSPYIEILRDLKSFYPFLNHKYTLIEIYFQRDYTIPSYLNAIGIRKFPSITIHLRWKFKGDQYFLFEGLSFNPQEKKYLIDTKLFEYLNQDKIKKLLRKTL